MTVKSDPFVIPILSAANFVIGMGAFMVIGLIDPLAEGLTMTTAQAGWIMTTYALSYAVLSPLFVSATGAFGRRRVIATGLVVFALANLVMALAPDASWVFGARIIAAGGAGIVTPVVASVAAGISAPEHRAKALSTVFIGMTLAQVIGVPAGSFIAYTFGWRTAFWVVVFLSIPFIWLIWTRVPKGLSFQPVNLTDLRKILGNGPMMLAVMFTASFLSAIWVVYTYLAPLLTETMGWGRYGITLALIVFGVGAVIGNVLGGFLADRVGRGLIVNAAMLISGICCVLAGFVFGSPFWLVAIVTIVWGIFVVADSAQFSAMVTEVAPQHAVGTALSVQTSLGFLLTTVSIQVIPFLEQTVGWRFTFGILMFGPAFGIWAIRRLK